MASYWVCINIVYLLTLNIFLHIEYNNISTIVSLCILGLVISFEILSKLYPKLQKVLNQPYMETI